MLGTKTQAFGLSNREEILAGILKKMTCNALLKFIILGKETRKAKLSWD
jgi:hypothetical protein